MYATKVRIIPRRRIFENRLFVQQANVTEGELPKMNLRVIDYFPNKSEEFFGSFPMKSAVIGILFPKKSAVSCGLFQKKTVPHTPYGYRYLSTITFKGKSTRMIFRVIALL